MHAAESQGFYKLVMGAKSNEEKLAVFEKIKTEVARYFAAAKIQAAARGHQARAPQSGADLKTVFLKYCRYGKGTGATQTELDGKRFNKFCKENKLLHRKKFNGNACDLLFTSIKPKGAKVIDFSTFKDRGLPAIAQKLGITLDEVLSRVGGPQSSGTKAQYNKFHDDKSTWGAGVAAHGGPSTNDQKITLSNLADRSEADIRGSKKSKSNTGVDVAASHAFIYGP